MLEPIVAAAALALSAFLSTNTDNLLLLTILLGQRRQPRSAVWLGYAGCTVLIALGGLAAARLADSVPAEFAGWLGAIPLSLGIWKLFRAVANRSVSGEAQPAVQALGAAGVLVLMLANSADTVAVLMPLFAESPEPLTYVMAVTVVAAALGWCGVAQALGSRASVRRLLQRAERWVVPVLLMAIGLYIMIDTQTDTL